MADIATLVVKDPVTGRQYLDWAMQPPIDPPGDPNVTTGDLVTDHGLQTAVYISLFSDRRAADDDMLPTGDGDRRGWWGDMPPDGSLRPPKPTEMIGSRLWLLAGAKQTNITATRARHYALEALQWLVSDGVAQSLVVETGWIGRGTLGIIVRIAQRKPGSPRPVVLPYGFTWSATMVGRADPATMAATLAELGTESGGAIGTEDGGILGV